MTDVPKIVHHRLRATTPGQHRLEQVHPEADVLSAFAEQALSVAEREGVLQHLALCADCRDVIALALPAMDLTVMPAETESEGAETSLPDKERSNWLAWAGLRPTRLRGAHLTWAALAAGIAVAMLIGGPALRHLEKPNSSTTSAVRQTVAPAAPSELTARVASGSTGVRAGDAKPNAAGVLAQLSANKSGVEKPSRHAEGTLATAGSAKSGNAQAGYARNDSSTAATLAAPGPHGTLALDEAAKMKERVAVPAGSTSNPLTAESSTSNLMAREEAPAIIRAKPASEAEVNAPEKTAMAGSAEQAAVPLNGRNTLVVNGAAAQGSTVKQNVSWTIKGGVLQRSLDGGQNWQAAARAKHPLLCYANRGQEIWAGGQAGTLLHSSDGGTTWKLSLIHI